MDTTIDLADNIKACRTCGIHFVTPSKHQLKHLFQSCQEHSEIMRIRLELAQWNVEISENDGYPQYICNTCIHKFEQVFLLRAACINAQNEFRKFYSVPNGNITNIKIKTEIPDVDEEQAICDFIYVDELSDGEYDGATPFNIPHIPIKEEIIEAAAVPMEDSEQSINVLESASRVSLPQMDSVNARQTNTILHISTDVIECNLCHQFFSNQGDHKHHMQFVHDIGDFECHICGKEFKNTPSSRLKFHMKWHTLNKQVKCNFCAFVCHSKDALSAHKRTNHRKVNCKICGSGVLAKKLKSHLHRHELQQKYSCEYCAKAFATEIEMENHIWQIHATEDNSTASAMINFQIGYAHEQDDGNALNVTQEENMCQELQESLLYKYICAHCEHRFMKQIDLEIHVKEEHLTTIESRTPIIVDTDETMDSPETAQNLNEHTIFENFMNDNEMHLTSIKDPSMLAHEIHTPTCANNVTPNENMQKDDTELVSCSLADEVYNSTESETETSDLPTYVEGDLNTFACAKCPETFATIEQLREHHEQHLLAEQEKPNTSLNKSKFQCHLCVKSFDLKFRLNRHLNKHKNYAPL